MSRRKQSKPRQIKRLIGDLEEGEENPPDDLSLSGDEGGGSDQEDSAEGDGSSPTFTPLNNEELGSQGSPGTPFKEEQDKGPSQAVEEEEDEEEEEEQHWDGPDELDPREGDGTTAVLTRRDLKPDVVWGPYAGSVQAEDTGKGQEGERPRLTMVTKHPDCWLSKLPLATSFALANCIIYSQGEELFCKVTREVQRGNCLLAMLSGPAAEQLSPSATHNASVKEEPAFPAALHSEIQLLPQQAGMAAILATAVINKDIFPCKDCGIWYRSERNLQAHLMYYCASRQKPDGASPPQDKPKDSYPNERVCPFPHCKKSCPSASSLEIHMRTHSGERPFVCLICLSAFTTKANCERHLKVHTDTLNGVCHGCGFISTTRDILYSHLVTSHMVCQPGSRSEVYSPGLPLGTDSGVALKCQVCGFVADSTLLLRQHVQTHLEVRDPAEKSPVPRQSPPSRENPEPQDRELLACVPRPDSASPGTNGGSATPQNSSPTGELPATATIKEEPRSDSENACEAEPSEDTPCRGNSSPRSPPPVQVKTELPSPTPGTSPVHLGTGGPVLPAGAVFLPQYMFSPEATMMPQASEILAKMSEMVHSRLKRGQSPAGAPAFYAAGSPVQKGATCFECDITFNNVNNFYVHKRLYCSSRHQHGDTPSSKDRPVAPVAPVPPVAPVAYDSPPVAGDSQAPAHGDAEQEAEAAPAEVKTEEVGLKDAASSEGESGGRASEGSQSPGGPAEDSDEDPTRTFCQACNIRFSRHENYTVHKRFYCASRHDPSNQRPHSSKAAFLPQPIRTRKRKKMYEIHMARGEALAVKQEPPALPHRLCPAPSPSRSPEGDGPIDLSKRPRLREAPRAGIPALPLTDYHKCTACSISFNSIENYLGHKTFYCPATSLQQRSLEQLHKLKRPASTSPKNRHPERPDPGPERSDAKEVKTEKVLPGTHHPTVTKSPVLPGLPLSGSEVPIQHPALGTKARVASPGAPLVVCPYCPLSGAVTGDLMEHFRTAHGLVLTLQPTLSRVPPEDSEFQPVCVSPGTPRLSPRDATSATPPRPGVAPHRDVLNGRVKREAVSPSSPMVNGNPLGSHKGAVSPPAAAPLTVSPVPEALPLPPDRALMQEAPKAALVAPMQNGNTRFCRLCNIKFSSLSTFIAHKKYYCSSHSAEHVK